MLGALSPLACSAADEPLHAASDELSIRIRGHELAVIELDRGDGCGGDPTGYDRSTIARCSGIGLDKLPLDVSLVAESTRFEPARGTHSILVVSLADAGTERWYALVGLPVAARTQPSTVLVAGSTEVVLSALGIVTAPEVIAGALLATTGWFIFQHRGRVAATVQMLSERLEAAIREPATDLPERIGGVRVDSCKDPDSGDWRVSCPEAKRCDRDWLSNGGHRPEWPACAPPPLDVSGEPCTQVVLGRQADLVRYIGCPGFIGLHLRPAEWTPRSNDEFVGCAIEGRLGATCAKPIRIVSQNVPDYYPGEPFSNGATDYSKASWEFCQLARCGPSTFTEE